MSALGQKISSNVGQAKELATDINNAYWKTALHPIQTGKQAVGRLSHFATGSGEGRQQ